MILIDVEIPVMGLTCDFQADENVTVAELTDELRDTICLHRQCGCVGEAHALTLWDARRQVQLPGDRTVRACGIRTGTRLILV